MMMGGGGKAREPSVDRMTDSFTGGTDLSQDSQLSASTLSLELSQGSQPDPGEATYPPLPAADGDKVKPKKGSKKVKKKKVKSKSKENSPQSEPGTNTETPSTTQQVGHTDTGLKERRGNGNKSKASKSEKGDKKSRTLSRRPEPEGGNCTAPAVTGTVSDFDRIINGNEPLFSDLDNSGDDEANPPPPPRPHRQSRLRAAAAAAGGGGGMAGIFIPCSQLGLNSNTMIKYAIIGTELQNIFQVSNRLENDVSGLNRRIQLLEEDLERSEERLQSATEKLEEATKAADESERVRRCVENKLCAGDERIEDIETELKGAKQAAQEWEARYEEAARKLTVMEKDLEMFEDRADCAERKVRDLEDQSHTLTNNLRSLERCEEKASQREDSYEETIRDLTQRLKDHESRSEATEREVIRLQKHLELVEGELEDQRALNQRLQEDMDQCIGDIQAL